MIFNAGMGIKIALRITFITAPNSAPTTGIRMCPIPCKIPVAVWHKAKKIIEIAPTVSKMPPSEAFGNSMAMIWGPNTPIPTAAGTEMIMEIRMVRFIFRFTCFRSPKRLDAAMLGSTAVAMDEEMATGSVVSVTYFPESWPYKTVASVSE